MTEIQNSKQEHDDHESKSLIHEAEELKKIISSILKASIDLHSKFKPVYL